MKKILLIIGLFFVIIINAQTFQVGVNSYSPILFGDIVETDFNNPTAGYVATASGGSFEFMYYTKTNWGFGFKTNYTGYLKDINKYKEDFANSLGISDSNMIMQSLYMYYYFGFQLGVSHNFNVVGKFNIEPYLFLGAGGFTSPMEETTYFKDGQTFIRRKTLSGFASINYTPGVRFQWNLIDGHLGLALFIEYAGIVLEQRNEEIVTYSSNSFNKTYNEKNYNINALNIGGGISYRFGKGLDK